MVKKYSSKLIILRGNSGSGKSTIARELREKSKGQGRIALVEQDYLRRIVLKEKEKEGNDNIGLIKNVVRYALSHDYNVILEGIFYSGRYRSMIEQLLNMTQKPFVYYLNVSFQETLNRHKTKPDSHEFGEKEMKSWYRESDLLKVKGETVIDESSSLKNTVNKILEETGI